MSIQNVSPHVKLQRPEVKKQNNQPNVATNEFKPAPQQADSVSFSGKKSAHADSKQHHNGLGHKFAMFRNAAAATLGAIAIGLTGGEAIAQEAPVIQQTRQSGAAALVQTTPIPIMNENDINWDPLQVNGERDLTRVTSEFGGSDSTGIHGYNGDSTDNLRISPVGTPEFSDIRNNTLTEYVGDPSQLQITGAGQNAPIDPATGNPFVVVESDNFNADQAAPGSYLVFDRDDLNPAAANHYQNVEVFSAPSPNGGTDYILESRNDSNSNVPGTNAGLGIPGVNGQPGTAMVQNDDGTVEAVQVTGTDGNEVTIRTQDGRTGRVQMADSPVYNVQQVTIQDVGRDGSVSETTSETTTSNQERTEIREELRTEERTVNGELEAQEVNVVDGSREFTNEYEREHVQTEQFSVEDQEPMDGVDFQRSVPYLEQVPVTDENGEPTGQFYDYVTPRTETNAVSVDTNGQVNFLHQRPLNNDGNVQGRVGATVDIPNEQLTIQGGLTVTNDRTEPIMRDPDGDGVYSPVEASGEVLETRRPGLFNSGTPVREVVVDDYVAPDGTVYPGGHTVEDISSENGPVVDGYVDATIAAYGQNVEVTETTYETETRVDDDVVDTYQQTTRTTNTTPGVVPFANTFSDTFQDEIQDRYNDQFDNTTTTTQTDYYNQDGIRDGNNTMLNDPQYQGSTITSTSASDLVRSDLIGSEVIDSELIGSELVNSELGDFQATGRTRSNTVDVGNPTLLNSEVINREITRDTRQVDQETWTEFQVGMNGNLEAGLDINLDTTGRQWLNPNRFNDNPEGRNENLNIRPTSEATFEDYLPAGPPPGSVNSSQLSLNVGADFPIAGRQPFDSNTVNAYVGGGLDIRLGGETHTPQIVYADGTVGDRYRTQPKLDDEGQPIFQEENGVRYQVMEYVTYPEGHELEGHPIPYEQVRADGDATMLRGEVRHYVTGDRSGQTEGRAMIEHRF